MHLYTEPKQIFYARSERLDAFEEVTPTPFDPEAVCLRAGLTHRVGCYTKVVCDKAVRLFEVEGPVDHYIALVNGKYALSLAPMKRWKECWYIEEGEKLYVGGTLLACVDAYWHLYLSTHERSLQ